MNIIPGNQNKIVKIKLINVVWLHEFWWRYTANGGKKNAMMQRTILSTIVSRFCVLLNLSKKMKQSTSFYTEFIFHVSIGCWLATVTRSMT